MTTGQLELHGILEEWKSVRDFLFESEIPAKEEFQDWGTDWGWKDDETDTRRDVASSSSDDQKEKKQTEQSETWLNECIVANSPMGDVFALSRGTKAAFLTGEWDSRCSRMRFTTTYQGTLSQEEGEMISSLACIPLVSKKKSNPGSPDWTCFVVGFSSGNVRMYSETGSILIGQLFHNQPVQSFKVRSYIPALTAMEHDQMEELIVLYKTVVVTMDGFGLFQTLRACRNHLARLKANAADTMVDPPPLTYKKWGFEKDECINDCEVFGVNTPSTFDHLFNGSIIGGLHAKCSPVPQTSNIFVSSGKNPYLAFHYAQEGQAVPLLTEIAFAMASKLKSSILSAATGWLGFGGGTGVAKGSSPRLKEAPKIEPATMMSCRVFLPDNPRFGKRIIISPCRKLSVITDSLGRVILLDNERGISVRMWKGYRDAQCSWLQVDEEITSKTSRHNKEPRRATFLVIYAPRRGNLEVFAMQQGPKIATFYVSRNGRLLCTTFGMMGLNNIPIRTGNRPAVQCVFVDNEARLYTLRIPFHLALCDRTSSKVKDMHLLKAIQRLLRDDNFKETDVLNILVEIRMQTMINQAFRLLSQKCKNVDIFAKIIDAYLEKFCEDGEKDLSTVFCLQSLLILYNSLVESTKSPPTYNTSMEGDERTQHAKTVLYCLHVTDKEIKVLEDMAREHLSSKKSPAAKTVTFGSTEDFLDLNSFFSTLHIEFDPAKVKSSDAGGQIKINFKSEHLQQLGILLVCGCLNDTTDLVTWGKNLKNAGLIPSELLLLAFEFWTHKALVSSSYVALMERLYKVITALCELEGYKTVTNEFGRVSKWWEDIRKEIAKGSKIFHVHSFAAVCRAVAIDLQQNVEMEAAKLGEKAPLPEKSAEVDMQEAGPSGTNESGLTEASDSGWENMSLDLLKWNLLLKQFEDLHLLTIVLNQRPALEYPILPVLDNAIESISVIQLLDKGKGCIAELVGKWLTTIGIDPSLIVDDVSDSQDKSLASEMETGTEVKEIDKSSLAVTALLKSLKDNFSVSLSASIILANYCWEYCLEWNKDSNKVAYLDAAVKCATAISTPYVRQGMMSMMWTTFIVKKFSPVVSGNKSGIGRDKLVEKISGFSNPEKKQMFLKSCVAFLDLFMDANVQCEGVSPPPVNRSLKNHWSNDAASAALTDLALIQPHSNYEMILLHYQLALCAQFVNIFRIRRSTMKPLNFFDTKARNLLFQNMSNPAPFSNVEVDLALKTLREDFLCQVITGAIREIPEELSDSTTDRKEDFTQIIPSKDGIRICEQWIQKCFELARIWNLDLNGLRINQVCELYSFGFDSLGQEAIGAVSSRDVLGAKLLSIAGMRVSYVIQRKSENLTEIIASLSTNLSNWLDSLDYSTLRCLRFSKASIVELSQQVIQLIPESSYDYKLAEEVLQSVEYL